MRQTIVMAVGAVQLFIALTRSICFAQARQDKPHILWITVEDITTFIGAYGSEVKTPNVDQLAREGVLYTRAHTVVGVCAPSRAFFITGMYPTSVGAHHMRTGSSELSPPGVSANDKPDGVPTYSVVLPPEVKAGTCRGFCASNSISFVIMHGE